VSMSEQHMNGNGPNLAVIDGGLMPHDPVSDLRTYFDEEMSRALVTEVRISQMGVSGSTPLRTLRAVGVDAESLARQCMRVCTLDAQAFSRRTSYAIEAITNGTPMGRQTVVIESRNQMALSESEPANPEGFVGMEMRHHEGMMRILMLGIGHNQNQLENENKRLYARVTELEQREKDVAELRRDLLVQEADLEGVKAQGAARTAAQKMLYEQLAAMAPMAMQAILVQLQGEDGPIQQIKSFLQGLTPDEYGGILLSLKEENVNKLQSLLGEQLIPAKTQ
jgi:hypothetical protein